MLVFAGAFIMLIGWAGIIFSYSKRDDIEEYPHSFLISVLATLCGIVMCIYFGFPVNRANYAVFQQQKAYIEGHVTDTEIEDAALTAKKVELNDWLFRNQYRVGKHPYWYSDIPEGFLEETPIE